MTRSCQLTIHTLIGPYEVVQNWLVPAVSNKKTIRKCKKLQECNNFNLPVLVHGETSPALEGMLTRSTLLVALPASSAFLIALIAIRLSTNIPQITTTLQGAAITAPDVLVFWVVQCRVSPPYDIFFFFLIFVHVIKSQLSTRRNVFASEECQVEHP
jgi:hypothetical protein